MVLDRHAQEIAGLKPGEPRRARALHAEVDVPADEATVVIGPQDTRQQAGLAQHLEAVADAEHRAAGRGERLDLAHHRREAGDRAGAQIVAVGEPARDDHARAALEIGVGVPERDGLAARAGPPRAGHRDRRRSPGT